MIELLVDEASRRSRSAPITFETSLRNPSRPRAENVEHNSVFLFNHRPVNQQPRQGRAPKAMNNAVPRGGADGGNLQAMSRSYIEISDDEDPNDDVIPVPRPATPRRQKPPVQQNNYPVVLSPQPSPLPAADGNAAQQPGANVAPNPPGQEEYAGIPGDAELAAFVIEDGDEFDVNDPYLAQIMEEGFIRERNEQASRPPQPATEYASIQAYFDNPSPPSAMETRLQCIDQVIAVFPDICRDYVSELHSTIAQTSDFLIGYILDTVDKGTLYPKAKDTQKTLKRKREMGEDEEAARKYGAADRVIPDGPGGCRPFIRTLLSKDFPETPMTFIDSALSQSGYRLFSTYRVLEEAHRTFDPRQPLYNKIRLTKTRKMEDNFTDANIENTIERMMQTGYQIQEAEILRELRAARRMRKKAEAKRQAEFQAEIEEEKNLRKAEAEGTMSECGCCFNDYPLNRMVHCNHEVLMHWFCRGCAKKNADTEIGNSKYHLGCMSMDGCDASFSLDQRNQFLDESTVIALERNEQEANLRMAGIENLASCPFCPYAAEYPPIEINREFRCQAPDCEKISCRLCKLESHIPKTCEENAKETGLSIRRQIEEAMSAALIRKCNKCQTPFVKEEGCNKMTCTRPGCRNIQCYVCSKSCDYSHFDDTRRGGKPGNCPLFESVEERHDNEVKKAEQEALDKVRAEHPEYTEEDLKIKVSEKVKKDDERRKANDPRNPARARGGVAPGRYGPPLFFPFQPVPPAYPGPAVGLPPAYIQQPGQVPPAVYQPQARPIPDFNDFLAAAGNYQGPLDGALFAGPWDDLPGLGLEPPGGYPGHPPPPPLQGRVHILPHRAPQAQVVVNQPAQLGLQAGPPQDQSPAPAVPQNQWNFGPLPMGLGMGPGNPQLFQLPRRAPQPPSLGQPAQQVQPPAPFNGNQPANQPEVDKWQRLQQIRENIANIRQEAGGNPAPPPAPANMRAHGQIRQAQQLQAQQMRFDFAPPVAIQPAAVQMQGVVGGRMRRNSFRGPAHPLNPPNGQA